MFHHEGLVNGAAHVHQRKTDVITGGAHPKDGGEAQQDKEWDRECLCDDDQLDLAGAICQRRRNEQPDAHCQ